MHSIVIGKGIVKKKGIKIAALFYFLSIACCAQAQNISLSLKNEPIEKAFISIETQTHFRFIYSSETVKDAKRVTIQLSNANIRDALSKLFYEQPLTYSIVDQQVIVKAAEVKQTVDRMDVRGRVLDDETGNPIPGVNVAVKGYAVVSVTDSNGDFNLKDLGGDEMLIFSMIGYRRMELPVKNQRSLLVRLEVSVSVLDETIVKGYYNTTRRLNTGSVGKVSGEEIRKQPVSNVLAAMQGRVPGLLITQKNGLPGSNFSVLIRGQNSIQSGNSPLYIIDGVPFLSDADVLTQRSGINASSPLNTIDPADIESIEVLKDADATAIYGSRGANGVILITTRKGKAGSTTIDANFYKGWGRVTHLMPYMNTQQYLMMRHEAFKNDNVIPDASNAFDFMVWDSTRYTDLPKLLIGGTAVTTNINLRMSGGVEGTRFTLGTGYNRQTTVFPGDNNDHRTTVDFSLNHALPGKKFSLSLASSYSNERSDLFNLDLTQFINLPPTIPNLYDAAGNLNWNSGGFNFYNPIAVTMQDYIVSSDRLTANLGLNYALGSTINLKSNFGYNNLVADENTRFPITSQDPAFAPTGSAFFGNSRFNNWIIEPQAEYHSAIGKKGKLQLLAGGSWQNNNINRTAISGSGYTNDKLLESTSGASSVDTKKSAVQYRYNSFFGRLNYSFEDKYLVNLTGRRDGSSRFGPGKQFANFGAVGIAWVFTGEKWLSNNLPFISFGKIRASYGITGNDLIGDYQYLDTYRFTTYPYQGDPSLLPQKLFNPNYSWEQIRKRDIAIELVLFNDRIKVEADYFENRSRNQIISYSLPGQVGFSGVLQNFPGVVQNKGLELQLSADAIRTTKFGWHPSFQLTMTDNKLLNFPGLASSTYSTRYTIGKPLNSQVGYLFTGVNPQTGVYEFLDKSKNPTIAPTIADYTYIGTTDPDFYGSFSNDLNFLNWTLSFLMEFRKQKGMDPLYGHFEMAGSNQNEPVLILNRWQKAGDIAPYQRFTQTYGTATTAAQNLSRSTAFFTDASFIRLKSFSLSYNLDKELLQKAFMKSARFYIEGQNLLLITKYKGNDPETQNYLTLPPLRVMAAGIQLSF